MSSHLARGSTGDASTAVQGVVAAGPTGGKGRVGGADTQNCMRMRKLDGKWDDTVCDQTNTKAFVCKKK